MSNQFKVKKAINISSGGTGADSGDITVNSNELEFHNGTNSKKIATESNTVTLSNKTLDNSTVATVKDANFTIQDDSDTSKQAKFQASGISTSTTRTFTLPDASTTVVGTDATQTLTNKTLNGNTATNLISGSGTLTLNTSGTVTVPNATDTLVGKATTDTLTNKTLNGNTATNLISGSGTLTLNTSGTVTLPNATDTLVGKATTDTLTNKTLTSPIISSISNTGTLTLPTSSDTLVGRATTDTLTNKTVSRATNTLSGYTARAVITANSSGNAGAGVAPSTSGNVLTSDGTDWVSSPTAALTVISKATADSPYTALTSDGVILVNATAGVFTLNLPAASGNSGKVFRIKKTDSSFNAITVDGNSSETIDGSTTTTLNTQYEQLEIVCDGSNWHILERQIDESWKSFTPTGGWTSVSGGGQATYTGRYRRMGDNMELNYKVSLGGAPNVAGLSLDIPFSLAIDTTKIAGVAVADGTPLLHSIGYLRDSGVADAQGTILYNNTTSVLATVLLVNGTYATVSLVTSSTPWAWGANDALEYWVTVPISGWK